MKIVCLCLTEKTTGKYLGLATKNNLNIYEFATSLSLISSCGNNGVVGRLNKTLCDKGSGWHIERGALLVFFAHLSRVGGLLNLTNIYIKVNFP